MSVNVCMIPGAGAGLNGVRGMYCQLRSWITTHRNSQVSVCSVVRVQFPAHSAQDQTIQTLEAKEPLPKCQVIRISLRPDQDHPFNAQGKKHMPLKTRSNPVTSGVIGREVRGKQPSNAAET